MKKYVLLIIVLFVFQFSKANNLLIENVSYDQASRELTFDISWNNAWNFGQGAYKDAVWIFMKYNLPNSKQWHSIEIGAPTFVHDNQVDVYHPYQAFGPGIIVYPAGQEGQFDIQSSTITVQHVNLPTEIEPSIKVFGI